LTAAVGAAGFAGVAAATDEPTRQPAVRRAPVVIEPALIAASETVEARAAVQQLAQAVLERNVIERALAEKAERESIWDRIAACETQRNWSMRGSSFSGGVGFSNAAWDQWGGREFAPNAGRATREQQIIVAERIRASVGLRAWGCAKTLGFTGR
jgi:Transglycosylase-like domain